MIASVWRVVTPEREMLRFVQHCEIDILPKYRSAPGLHFVGLWSRACIGYADVQVVSIWRSPDDLGRFFDANLFRGFKEKPDHIIVPDRVDTRYDVVAWMASSSPQSE